MKKRIVSLVLVIVLVVSLCVPAMGTATENCTNISHSHSHSAESEWKAWDGTTAFPSGEVSVYLIDNVTTSITLIEGTVNLCLNGKSLTVNQAIGLADGVTLNLCDCSGGGSISGSRYGIENYGTVNINGGTVSGFEYGIKNYGTVSINGGTVSGDEDGICNNNDATVTVSSGTVSGGTGDGILNFRGGTVTVSGGTVSSTRGYAGSKGINNQEGTVTVSGGTISGHKYGIYNHKGTVTVSGGAVSNTYADGNSGGIGNVGNTTVKGGTVSGARWGIFNFEEGTVTVSDGTVSGLEDGIWNIGAVNVKGGTISGVNHGIVNDFGSTVTVSGKPTITGGNGVDIWGDSIIIIGGALTYTDAISVYWGYASVFTSGWSTYMFNVAAEDIGKYFTSADTAYVVRLDGNGELELAEHYTCGNGICIPGQAASCTVDGWNDYYKCSCGKFYTTADCSTEITDLEAWKTGDGKIAAGHDYGELIASSGEIHTQTELKGAVAAHYFCDVCDTYFTEGKVETTLESLTGAAPEHSYGDWINTDSIKHWKACSCGLKTEEGNHVYDNDSDTGCNTCGYNRGITDPTPTPDDPVDPDNPVNPDEPDEDVPCDGGKDCTANKFTDVNTAAWYHEAIDYVLDKGLMNGTSATTFEPGLTTTRAMIVTTLYRLEGEPDVKAENSYTDVKDGVWYTDAIIWANANGIVTGYGDGKFGPQDQVTRQQIATIFYRYAQYKGLDISDTADVSKFSDSNKISSWALEAMKWANGSGLMVGRTETTLVPGGSATRAEIATLLYRWCEVIIK